MKPPGGIKNRDCCILAAVPVKCSLRLREIWINPCEIRLPPGEIALRAETVSFRDEEISAYSRPLGSPSGVCAPRSESKFP